ncbi:MAG: sulfide/dihydroorotate dehydrogenase-like FAD/NAD-binding protein [Candidatus Aureabacteria bacterium]|nr:sulfide/dihydroorotate dehydrogenase-like FAD/NAD-binding protein [Candidatus Auribacterota bacterium]
MHKIMSKKKIAEDIYKIVLEAPAVAAKRKAGQFVVLRPEETSERIPLTIFDSDAGKGTITIIVQVVGKTTKKIALLEEGETLLDVAGPLGNPTHIERKGNIAVVGGGVGTAVAYPVAKAFREAGNDVIGIIGARTKELVILEDEMKAITSELLITTDDGSYGRKGFVTDALKEVIRKITVAEVLAVGPVPMMKAVCNLTKQHNIRTMVSLNPIMVDGTGMCGACRVTVAGKTRFTCVDGPEFDGHEVDFDELTKRLKGYSDMEKHYIGHKGCNLENKV